MTHRILLALMLSAGCSVNTSSELTSDPTTPKVVNGAVIYVTPRNNEIVPNGDYKYTYNIEFLVDRTTTLSDVKEDLSITLNNQALSILNIVSQDSYSGTYYTASFSYTGTSTDPQALLNDPLIKQIQICANSSCSSVSPVDVIDVKRSVGFEAISRRGFGYGLYVSLLLPDYDLQPINASTFFSSKDPGLYTALTPLWNWSEVDWEFVPMNSTLAGRNEFMYCSQPGTLDCILYWTQMKPTTTTIPFVDSTGMGYTLDQIIANSGLDTISSFDLLEPYVLSNQTRFLSFDNTPHGVAINTALMGGIPGFEGAQNWGQVTLNDLRQRFLTLNIIHMPYGNPVSTLTLPSAPRTDADKIPSSTSFLGNNYVGHGLIGTEIYNELYNNGPARTGVGANYSSPTGVVGASGFNPYGKFYYYAVNYTATSMDFYIVDPDDSNLKGKPLDNTNIHKFKPVRSFKIRNNAADVAGSAADHDNYGLIKFGLDEPNSGEGCNIPVYSYGAQNGFCALKWQIQTWLIAGLAGSEYATQNLFARNYLKKIAVYPASGTKQEIDFTQFNDNLGDKNYWLYNFQKEFAITNAMGPYLGDSGSYLVKGFWNLSYDLDYKALNFTQMPFQIYEDMSKAYSSRLGRDVYLLTGSGHNDVKLDAPGYAFAHVDSYDLSESEVFSIPQGQSATVTVSPIVDTSSPLTLGAVSQTCTIKFNFDGSMTNSCSNAPFTISKVQNVQINLNAPAAVNAAQLQSCSNGRCTFTTSWTPPTQQYPGASLFIVPNQSWVGSVPDYYKDLITNGNALISATQTSATFSVDQKYVGPSNPNVSIYACLKGSCPNANNGYAIVGIPGTSSSTGKDLLPVTSLSVPTFSGKTVSATWINPANQDPNAQCYINLTGSLLSSATGNIFQKCSLNSGSITFSSPVSSGTIMVSSCINNSYVNTCPVGPNYTLTPGAVIVNTTPTGSAAPSLLPPASVNPATLGTCSNGRCTFTVSWTNPSTQAPGAQYLIAPNPQGAPAYYEDLVSGGALVSATKTSATFTVNQIYVGSNSPNVMMYACTGASCPSTTNGSIANLAARPSTGGVDLLAVTALSTTNTINPATLQLTANWTNPPNQPTNAYCYLNVTGYNTVVPTTLPLCSAGTATMTLTGAPASTVPKTFSVVSCMKEACNPASPGLGAQLNSNAATYQ